MERPKAAIVATGAGAAAAALAPPTERFRCVTPDGAVVVHLSNGDVTVLQPDGGVSQRAAADDAWVHTAKGGERWRQPDPKPAPPIEEEELEAAAEAAAESGEEAPAAVPPHPAPGTPATPAAVPEGEADQGAESGEAPAAPRVTRMVPQPPQPLEAVPAAEVVDPDTGATAVTRGDLVLSVAYPAGMGLTVHADGSRLHRAPCQARKPQRNPQETRREPAGNPHRNPQGIRRQPAPEPAQNPQVTRRLNSGFSAWSDEPAHWLVRRSGGVLPRRAGCWLAGRRAGC